MTFIAGWRAEDIVNPTSAAIAGPDNLALRGPAGGFTVPAGATIEAVVFRSANNAPGRFAIYGLNNALLAQTGNFTGVGSGTEMTIPLLSPWSPAEETKVFIGCNTSSYLSGYRGDQNIRYMETGPATFSEPLPDPFVMSGTQNFGKIELWLSGTFAATGPSIPAADDIISEGQSATFTLSGNTAAPVSATLNGTDVGTLTDQGSGVYSYTAPLIADDDTADLVVSVDGTTAGATIAYANSYDRDQLTHPATEAEYSENSLSYPNAYATTQPYEWKVIADANASVVTINWNALEADDGFHKDVASYATPVANGSTTVTLGVFVPETGQAYQFDRTITVSDGSVVVSSEDGAVGAALTPAISDAIEDAIA